MRIDVKQASELLRQQDNILILAHENPDGDTLGCAYALCRALHNLNKKARVACADKTPHIFDFIPRGVEVQDFEEQFIVSVDIADMSLLGDEEYAAQYRERIDLCVDHHGSNSMTAKYICMEEEPEAAACAETVLLIIRELGAPIDEIIARCIYVGITTDTGCFRYSNTTSRSLRMAADMVDVGLNTGKINKLTFETRTKTYTALETLALSSMKMFFDGKCAVIKITQDMYEKSGSDESETHPITAIPRQIEGVLVGAAIKETKDGATYKISVRTNAPANAANICAKMGGGGHRRAAGCALKGRTLEEVYETLINAIGEELEQALKETGE
ncbi:MAG: DHH family phosphoesterase [Oscillospiraceae bacterium]|jgi:phosphoesterase RecJ-like protein|nr:DHH family phosphoesterase [Oscillospiraceae bacterium]